MLPTRAHGRGEGLWYDAGVPERLARSLIRETSGLFVLGIAGVTLLLSIDLLSVLARFLIEQEASLPTIGRLLLAKLPWFLHLALPVAAVFAVLVAGGRMARDSELKAAQAGGIAPRALIVPLVAWGLAVSALAIVNNGMWEPRAERTYQRIIDGFLYGRAPTASDRDVSFLLGDTIFHAARIRADRDDPSVASLEGILVRLEDGTLLTARRGTWRSQEREWILADGWEVPVEGDPIESDGVTLPFDLPADPSETLARGETLTLEEIQSRIVEQRLAGSDVRDLRFELHRRLADAASAAVFVLAAAALALRVRGQAGGVAWTIILVAGFWAVWTFSAALYEQGVLGPIAAAWGTPAVVAAVGASLALRSDAP